MLERNLQSTIQGLMSVEAFRSKCQEYLVKERGYYYSITYNISRNLLVL